MPRTDSILELVAGTDLTPAGIAAATGHSVAYCAGWIDGWLSNEEQLEALPHELGVGGAMDYLSGRRAGREAWDEMTRGGN